MSEIRTKPTKLEKLMLEFANISANMFEVMGIYGILKSQNLSPITNPTFFYIITGLALDGISLLHQKTMKYNLKDLLLYTRTKYRVLGFK